MVAPCTTPSAGTWLWRPVRCCYLLPAAAAGALLSVLLVDRIGRLPLLRISSLVAATLCAVLVAMASQYAHQLDTNLSDATMPAPTKWPIIQLAALATLSVSVPACCLLPVTLSGFVCDCVGFCGCLPAFSLCTF
jgi:hypothetical protein